MCVLTTASLRNPPHHHCQIIPFLLPIFPLFLDWTGRDNLGLERAVRPGVFLIHLDGADMFNIHRSSAAGLDTLHYISFRGKIGADLGTLDVKLRARMNAVAACWAAAEQLILSPADSMNVVLTYWHIYCMWLMSWSLSLSNCFFPFYYCLSGTFSNLCSDIPIIPALLSNAPVTKCLCRVAGKIILFD